jgi:hypothetical protein
MLSFLDSDSCHVIYSNYLEVKFQDLQYDLMSVLSPSSLILIWLLSNPVISCTWIT